MTFQSWGVLSPDVVLKSCNEKKHQKLQKFSRSGFKNMRDHWQIPYFSLFFISSGNLTVCELEMAIEIYRS
jgi:hypothetical protein